MHTQEFLERYQQGERNFAHVDLSGATLSGVNLREVDLTGANLTGANLSWSFFSKATFVGACLRRADMRNAMLTGVNLNQSNLSGVNLSKADLRMASLCDADLNWAILTEADLSNANLSGAKSDQINLERAKLDGVKLMGAELMEANMKRASLIGANLTGANLREAHLTEANLRDSNFQGANLIEADLNGVTLRGANLSDADMHRIILTGADLTEAVLNNADLSRANLMGAYLLKSSFKKAHLLRANLQEVFLLWADLTEANLRGADLRKADLSGAYLSDAMLGEADLRDSFLIETHLIRTNLEGSQLTGCCIHNWQIEEVDLSKLDCLYVFTHFNYTTKKPINRYPLDRDFAPGEFGQKPEENNSIIEVIFPDSPNWEALAFTLAEMELENQDALQLKIIFFEATEQHNLLRLNANRLVNSKLLAKNFLRIYANMLKRVMARRSKLLMLLNLATPPSDSSPQALEETTSAPLKPISDKRREIYKEVSHQIKSILLSQSPENFVDSVQRLLDYLKQQGISTGEIQKKLISQVILKRAQQDTAFREQLLRWDQMASEKARFSMVGESVRYAIALLWQEK
jgi:uncharacterized protein YjbI with pentapeptide repeats